MVELELWKILVFYSFLGVKTNTVVCKFASANQSSLTNFSNL